MRPWEAAQTVANGHGVRPRRSLECGICRLFSAEDQEVDEAGRTVEGRFRMLRAGAQLERTRAGEVAALVAPLGPASPARARNECGTCVPDPLSGAAALERRRRHRNEFDPVD